MNNILQPQPNPSIIYQDNDLLVVNKPPGLLSVPDGYDPDLPHLRSVLEPLHGALWMVHRLDKDTSGLVILARNESSHRKLNALFRERNIDKVYHALVTPPPEFQNKTINLPLKPDADRKHRTRVNLKDGKEAHSILSVIKRFHLGVLMEIKILTGITHQIRAHLRSEDLLVFGETLYNASLPVQPLPAPRAMLHARQISFFHPESGESLRLSAPYPQDFRTLYTQLRFTRAQDKGI